MKLKIQGVPPSQYTLELAGIEEKEADNERGYGPALIWQFLVVGGPYDGQLVPRFTGNSPTAKNAAGKFLKAVTGKSIEPGVTVDLDEFIGRRYLGIVADAPSGNGTRVETLVAIAEGAA